MHIEVKVALNFVISYLYNKLPRLRVNVFGEELERALKRKFEGHWYPDMPIKGSAFRVCDPVDPLIEQAAKYSGVEVGDVRKSLPEELSVWIDPGEVSYRIGEEETVNILYDKTADNAASEDGSTDREVSRTLNPEAQCFEPIEASLSRMGISSIGPSSGIESGSSSTGDPSSPPPLGFMDQTSMPAFWPNASAPVTFTTAAFAQTKFGSTRLKSSAKRSPRRSPTEFSNYIKQRALQQQLNRQQQKNRHLQLHATPKKLQPCVTPVFSCRRPTQQQQQQKRPRSRSPKPSPQQPLDPILTMAPPPSNHGFLGEPGRRSLLL